MARFTSTLVMVVGLLLIPFVLPGPIARASGGSSTGQTVAVYRQTCSATVGGQAVGTARFSPDDQGGNPGGLEIRTGITAGLSRASYSVYVLVSPCQVLVNAGTLTTDDSGRGDLDSHVSGTLVPAGAALRVELVAPGDTLTSDSTSSM